MKPTRILSAIALLFLACALAASGVRSNAGRPTRISRRELRRRTKARQQAQKAAAGAEGAVDVRAVEIDWSMPETAEGEPDAYAWAEAERGPRTEHRVPF